jgi:hypothetical protein
LNTAVGKCLPVATSTIRTGVAGPTGASKFRSENDALPDPRRLLLRRA